jgi:dephospho-CoA kinase
MKVIGLTGGIGSGKSTVSRLLAELDAVIINADELGHEILRLDNKVWQEVVAAFGKQIVTANGIIDRKRLGAIVFSNSEARARLNRIMHPRILYKVKAQLEEHRRQGAGVVIIEAPLLLEAGWTSLINEVWVTIATRATVLKRLKERARLSESESIARILSQLPVEEKLRHADVVIDTDCDLDELRIKVKELWQRFQTRV